MKIKGRKIECPNIEYIVIPRPGEDIVFKAKAVLDFESFEKICPEPKPPKVLKRGIGIIEDTEDEGYKEEVKQYGMKRYNWLIITSLRDSEIEWEKVDYSDPNTWHLFEEELKESGFGQVEINKIKLGVMSANALDEDKLEQARKRFLAGQEEMQRSISSQNTEQKNTPSGVAVNGSA